MFARSVRRCIQAEEIVGRSWQNGDDGGVEDAADTLREESPVGSGEIGGIFQNVITVPFNLGVRARQAYCELIRAGLQSKLHRGSISVDARSELGLSIEGCGAGCEVRRRKTRTRRYARSTTRRSEPLNRFTGKDRD